MMPIGSTAAAASAAPRLGQVGVVGRIALVVMLLIGTAMAALDPFNTVDFVSYGAIGAFLIVRRPRNAIGWLLVGLAWCVIGTTGPTEVNLPGLIDGTGPLDQFTRVWISTWAGGVSWVLYAALAWTFPSGSLPTGRWRPLIIFGLLAGVVVAIVPALAATFPYTGPNGIATDLIVRNRFGVLPALDPSVFGSAVVVITVVPLIVFACAVVSAIVRYRRSSGIIRLQLRWFFASVAFVLLAVFAGLAGFAIVGPGPGILLWVPAIIAYPTVPIAIGIAVSRYRLFDIDRIISRTISYLVISTILVALYVAIVLLLRGLIGGFVGNGAIVVAGSTLIVASLFQPLRRRIQKVVDRRFDRQRYDADRTVATFAERVRDQVELEPLLTGLDAIVRSAVAPRASGIWLRERAD